MKSQIYAAQRASFQNIHPGNSVDDVRTRAREAVALAIPTQIRSDRQRYARLDDLLGLEPDSQHKSVASHQAAMAAFSDALGKAVSQVWKTNGFRELEFLTITPPAWVISDRTPVVELKRWRSEVSRWMKRLGIVGIAVVEAAPFVNYPGSTAGERFIAFHVHIVGYTINPSKYHERCESLRYQLEANSPVGFPVLVTKVVNQSQHDVAYVASYIVKVPSSAKRLSLRRDGKRKYVLRNGLLRRQHALRIAEIMSYLSFGDIVVTRGVVGRSMKHEALKLTGPNMRQRFPWRLPEGVVRRLWDNLRRSYAGQTKARVRQERALAYAPVRICR